MLPSLDLAAIRKAAATPCYPANVANVANGDMGGKLAGLAGLAISSESESTAKPPLQLATVSRISNVSNVSKVAGGANALPARTQSVATVATVASSQLVPAPTPAGPFSVHAPWNVADNAYQNHHWQCPQCRVNARTRDREPRCAIGQELYTAYELAAMKGHQ